MLGLFLTVGIQASTGLKRNVSAELTYVCGSGRGQTVEKPLLCDYVHLNPARARLLKAPERLLAYPWSSSPGYPAAPKHRPGWIRVVSHRWSPAAMQIRDFLGRNFIPYQWLDIEKDALAKELAASSKIECSSLPLVVFQDGSFLANPTAAAVAGRLGLRTRAEQPLYDLTVVGGGPAGLAAAVYGAADGLRTLLIEREAPGGQAGRSSRIENYLGFPTGPSGGDLARRAVAQARRFGVEILAPREVVGVRVEGPSRVARLADESEVVTRALLSWQ